MHVPAINGFETGKPLVFSSAVRKTDLLSQSGTADIRIITRGRACPVHLARLIGRTPGDLGEVPGKGSLDLLNRFTWSVLFRFGQTFETTQ